MASAAIDDTSCSTQLLQADKVYQPFLEPAFQQSEYASSVLHDPDVAAKSQHLHDAILRLDVAIRDEVVSKQGELLGHARRLQDSEKSLQRVQTSVDTLNSTVKRIRDDIYEPFERVRRQATQLSNLHSVIDALRLVNHRLKLTSKLRQVLTSDENIDHMDLAKAAKLLKDLDTASAEGDLAGITVMDRDIEFVSQSRARVTEEAQLLLQRGMSTLGQAEVASSLQVFYNLGALKGAVHDCLSSYITPVATRLSTAMDARHLSGVAGASGGAIRGLAGPGGAARVQEALWKALDDVSIQMHTSAVAVWHLQRVVSKKRDPLSLTAFSDVLQADRSLLDTYWVSVADAMSKAIHGAMARAGAVRDALAHSFPQLSDLIESLFTRVARDTDVPGTSTATGAAHRAAIAAAVSPFQEAFVNASIARLQEAVNAWYPVYALRVAPSHSDVQKCISKLHEELKYGGTSPQLHALMGVAVGKALGLMGNRVLSAAAVGQELKNVTGPATPAQLLNITHSSHLFDVHRSFVSLVPRLPIQAQEVLREPLEHLQSSSMEPVVPLFKAASDAISAFILQMHSHPWNSHAAASVMRTSPHVQRLAGFLSHLRAEFLSHFSPPPSPNFPSFAALLTQRLASHALVFFVRHASLLRPLSHAGKLQLAKDMTDLEQELRQHLYPPDLLGESHQMFRAFRSLLFMETDAIIGATTPPMLPKSILLFHLFSRLPESVLTPPQRSKVSAKQYSQWMDSHTASDVLQSVSVALDAADKSSLSEQEAPLFDYMNKLVTS